LFAKYLLVLVPIFLALSIPGLALLLGYELRDHQDALATRIGNQTARVAAAFARHDTSSNPRLAQDLLDSLASDRAFLCAEVRASDGARIMHAAPANTGCLGETGGLELTLAVGDDRAATLTVRFTDMEIVEAKQFQRSLTLLVILVSMLIAVIAASFGFRLIVARPLAQLLAAMRQNADTGERIVVETSGNDEFAAVAAAFNDMLTREAEREHALESTNEALRETQEQYETLNTELEERVHARTSELRRRERALRQSEQRFADFAKASSDWYWEMDEHLRFSYFSHRFLEITDLPPTALLGKSRPETSIPNVDPEQWQRHLDALAKHEPFRNFIHPRENSDGTTVWLSVNGVPHFDDQGTFKGYRGTGQEITELVAAREHAERARAYAETANEAKSQFLANMSHELRTPLNAIIGFSQAIEEESFGSIEQRIYTEYAGFVRASGNHLLEIISDILDLSKIEAGHDDVSEEIFDVHDTVHTTAAMLRNRAQDGEVAFDVDIEEGLPRILADRRKLKQILVNLLSNAVKFTPAGGSVILKVTHPADTGFVFQVVDTGIGMAEADIPKALTPFRQIQDHLNRTYEGTGLGLPLAKVLAEQHGGLLEVDSRPGRGTTVTVRFPATRTVRAAGDAPPGIEASG
jgi:PAS domain S-box-containing protein